MADPWLKFYTSDWRADPRLKMCSAAARGVWIELICLMHEATPYGHLLVHGQNPNEAQLASLTGIPAAELHDLVAELERLGVFSRTKEGVIYSRKLVRMAAKSAKARKIGKMGGNPSLSKRTENKETDNRKHNGNDKPQKPEAISQKDRSPNGDPPELAEAVEVYRAAAERCDWPIVQRMSKPRLSALRQRLREAGGIEGWRAAISKAEASDFLCNRVPSKPFTASFDFLTQQSSFTKLMEGNYDNRGRTLQSPDRPQNRTDPALEQALRLAGLGRT
jgi:hypothetical protein